MACLSCTCIATRCTVVLGVSAQPIIFAAFFFLKERSLVGYKALAGGRFLGGTRYIFAVSTPAFPRAGELARFRRGGAIRRMLPLYP